MIEKSPAFEMLDGAINYAIIAKSVFVKIPTNTALEIRSNVAKQLEPLWPKKEITTINQAQVSYIKYYCCDCRMEILYGDNFCRHCGRKVLWNA